MIQKIRILQNENQQLNGDLGGCGLGPDDGEDEEDDGGVLGELSTSPMSSSSRDLSLCQPAAAAQNAGAMTTSDSMASGQKVVVSNAVSVMPRYDEGVVTGCGGSGVGKGANRQKRVRV